VTIRLSPDLEERIRERVAAGAAESVEAFVDFLLRNGLNAFGGPEATDPKTVEQIDKETDDFFESLDRLAPADLPDLPDEALRRESIYDHLG